MPLPCPACGATNPDSAQWCGQCYRRFDEPTREATPAPRETAVLEQEDTEAPAAFRRRGDTVEWACPQCDHFNAIELQHCEVCGTAFVERFAEPAEHVERDWSRALLLTLLAPGAGHISVGRVGSGAARLVLVVMCLTGIVGLAAAGGARALVAASPLILGAVAIWVGTAADVVRLQRGQPELLVGRRVLWLVVAILGLLGLSLVASVAVLS